MHSSVRKSMQFTLTLTLTRLLALGSIQFFDALLFLTTFAVADRCIVKRSYSLMPPCTHTHNAAPSRLHGSVSAVCLRVCGYCLLHKATLSHTRQHIFLCTFFNRSNDRKTIDFYSNERRRTLSAGSSCNLFSRPRVQTLPVGRSALSLHRKFVDSAPPPSPLRLQSWLVVVRNDSNSSHSPSTQIKRLVGVQLRRPI